MPGPCLHKAAPGRASLHSGQSQVLASAKTTHGRRPQQAKASCSALPERLVCPRRGPPLSHGGVGVERSSSGSFPLGHLRTGRSVGTCGGGRGHLRDGG